MINEKFSEEEVNNIKELDQLLNKDNKYIKIEPNSRKILRFILSKKMEPIEKEFKGTLFKQYRFYVIEENTDNTEKIFDVGKASAQAILDKFNEGYNVLDIARIGSGPSTRYIPRPIYANIE